MVRKTEKLDEIEAVTIDHYNQNAEAYWHGTENHDVVENYAAFLSPFPKDKILDILDLGCDPGRDVNYFKSLGHRPVGLDGSEIFCRMARQHSACQILQHTFLNLNLQNRSFDGIFANATLFHVPSQELPRVLFDLYASLRPGGIIFLSNPRGNHEGWSGQRYGHYVQLDTSKLFLEEAGFEVIDYFFRPHGKPNHEQPWLAITAKKPIL
jgi:SAM-dependent methyltransferase